MKIAYLVFAYTNPLVLAREIRALSCEDCAFFVHIDQKSKIQAFASIGGSNVFYSERRLPVFWAEFSGVEAILLLIRQALNSQVPYDYFVLLSGSEYPLRSAKYIHSFFVRHNGVEFINIVKVPNEAAGKPMARINTLVFPSTMPVYRFIMRALVKLGFPQRDYRKHLRGMDPYSGNTWWALTRAACQYICDFDDSTPNLRKYFRYVFAPEEAFIHTIIGNSEFRLKARRNLIYEDWFARGAHPGIISEQLVATFESSKQFYVEDVYGAGEVLFARKCSDNNLNVIDAIDRMIARQASDYEGLQCTE